MEGGVAKAGAAARSTAMIPSATYGACPRLKLMTVPVLLTGHAHRWKPVRHESGRLAGCLDGGNRVQSLADRVGNSFQLSAKLLFSRRLASVPRLLGEAPASRGGLLGISAALSLALLLPASGGAGRAPSA